MGRHSPLCCKAVTPVHKSLRKLSRQTWKVLACRLPLATFKRHGRRWKQRALFNGNAVNHTPMQRVSEKCMSFILSPDSRITLNITPVAGAGVDMLLG